MPRTEEKPWKIVYIMLCLALLTLAAYQFFIILPTSNLGWDYRIIVGAVQSLDHNQNPYIVKNIEQYAGGVGGPFVYPPYTLYFFWLLDSLFVYHYIVIYYVLLVILLIISGYLIVTLNHKPHYLFLTTLLVTGFMSLYWNFLTGNKDIFFLFLFAVIFILLIKEKYWQSSIVMGLAAAVSLITGPFIALYLVIRRPILDRLAYIVVSIGVVAALFLVSYCINPLFLASYIGTLQGTTSGTISPFNEPGGWNLPTPYWLFMELISSVSPGNGIPIILVSCIYIGIILYATWNYYQRHTGELLKIYSLVMLSVFMILPRIKPYDFIILVIPLYFLFKDCSYQIKSLVLSAISLLPLFVFFVRLYPRFGISLYNLPFLLGWYVQAYSLFLVFLAVILHDHLTPASNDEGKNLGE
jgi:hypothetical protein